jgi:4-alpha-glucanotransferase
VYRADAEDPLRAVQGGARLFESPDLSDHPELARYARVRAEQINPALPRHADHRVRELSQEQVDAYAVLIDTIVAAARAQGREVADLICEVLSTLPYPLEAVMKRHGLGRFRVLQKAALHDPTDVYRSENAQREDWVMLGNHDTPSVWELIPRWEREGKLPDRARYLAWRLVPERERDGFARMLLQSPGRVAHAMLADALASPAENAMLFFTDLFGIEAPYNVPGTQDPANWTLRLTRERIAAQEQLAREDRALDVRRAVAWALRARGAGESVSTALLAGIQPHG